MPHQIENLTEALFPLMEKISHHSLYSHIKTIVHLRAFMEQHVFAVWDFMCLLKELHRQLVSTSAPWFPPKDPLGANLISSILVEEEGDITEDGSYDSHYGIYLSAMKKIGADTSVIEKFLLHLQQGIDIHTALNSLPIRLATKQFVQTTFSFFTRELHELAAAFVYGREGITSMMFAPMIQQMKTEMGGQNDTQFSTFIYYCQRHIELDDQDHFPKALQMLENLIGDDKKKLQETKVAATQALTTRLNFLTDIQQSLSSK